MSTIRMGLVGFGKIARDEHLPAIAATEGAQLIAVASRNASAEGLPSYPDLAAMLAAHPELDAVILCQPPQVRYAAAREALLAGKHVFLEKPPGATLTEVEALVHLAKEQGVSLYASWHSRYAAPVARLREWCAGRVMKSVAITWKEDVHRWHPGQEWIWEAGGFGVFDPGINALSILTAVLDEPVLLTGAAITTPSNRAAPIAASLTMQTASGAPIACEFDWRQTEPQTWQIHFEAEDGEFTFAQGGEDAENTQADEDSALGGEYGAMYRHFVGLVRNGESDVDLAPLKLVADAFLCGHRIATDPLAF
jgi:D-galactose 1-dehydrogenase